MAYYTFTTSNGVFVVDTAGLQDEVIAEFKAAFGADLVTTPDTPQGVLITAETLARVGALTNTALIANQINPNVAEGVFLDAIWALTGGRRVPATKTRVTGALLTGVAGAIIPSGALAAVSTSGEQFALVSSVLLDIAGQGVGDFLAVNTGQIECNPNTLTVVVTGAIGWETVTNPTAGAGGSAVESDELSRRRRRVTLALQGVALGEAIYSGLNELPDTKSVSFRENFTNAPVVIDGINLVAHSMWACVDGATDDDVAKVILNKKSLGCDMNGATSVPIVDPITGQTYTIKFDRPTPVPVMCRVFVKNTGGIGDPITVVKQAILNYAAGLVNSENGFTLGTSVSSFELAGAINFVAPTLFISQLDVALLSGSPVWLNLLSIGIDEKATINESNIVVTLL